ncbi:MAG: hypothetical protein NT029_19950 [Armatimonadetes bacterium]|nr:hypothetical protein [Armatimonadota bacterium]
MPIFRLVAAALVAACALAPVSVMAAPDDTAGPVRPLVRTAVEDARAVAQGRRVLRRYLGSGMAARYTALETTRVLTGRVRESRQVVLHGGAGMERREYTWPARLRGDILLLARDATYHYRAAPTPRVLVGAAQIEAGRRRALIALRATATGRLKLRAVGTDEVAGRSADIVEIGGMPRSAVRRLWIDRATGVRLRVDMLDELGATQTTSYYTQIDFGAKQDPALFSPDSLPQAPRIQQP